MFRGSDPPEDRSRFLETLFDTLPYGIVEQDAEGRIVAANAAAQRILGVPAELLIGLSSEDPRWQGIHEDGTPWPGEDHPAVVAVRTGKPVDGALLGVLHPSSGEYRWLLVHAEPVFRPGEATPYAAYATFVDVTDLRRAKVAEERFQALFRSMAEGVALHEVLRDETGAPVNYRITDINPQYESIVGVQRNRVIGKLATEAYGTSQPPYLAEFTAPCSTGQPGRFETYFAPMDKHFQISVAPLDREHFATIFFDVSLEKRASERQEALLRHSPDYVTIIDARGKVMYHSPSAVRVHGWELEDYGGSSGFDLVHPDDRSRVQARMAALLANPDHIEHIEFRYATKSGGWVWLETVASNQLDNPSIRGVVSNTRDITARKKAEAERAELEEHLRHAQRMESIGRLAGGIAHDFNNLLTVIQGQASLAMIGLDARDPLARPLEDICRASRSAADLTRQLLTFSRRQVTQPRIVDLNEFMIGMARMLRRLLGEDIELTVIPLSLRATVRADPTQLEQIIINLAVNARDAMPQGGALTVETHNTRIGEEVARTHPDLRAGDYVLVKVTDTGAGMLPEVKEHLFEPFFTTKEEGKGTGLGLATVYGIVMQNGGSIEVHSEIGHGTSFHVYLPAVEDAAGALPEHRAEERLPHGNETILLVEDQDLVRDMIRHILDRLGYRVIAHSNGADALAAAEVYDGIIHLLLTDIVMPGMNGKELARRLRLMRTEIRVLYTSGFAESVIAREDELEDGSRFIAKPFGPLDLALRIRETIGTTLPQPR